MSNGAIRTHKHMKFQIQLWCGKVHQTGVSLSNVAIRVIAMQRGNASSERASVNSGSFETGISLDKTHEWII